ncbi:PD40 domain-containing protein, partial [candidate division KSB1 bacterium]|nr:PD40 domain-containing protein [candidate division KSB1 bacterium]
MKKSIVFFWCFFVAAVFLTGKTGYAQHSDLSRFNPEDVFQLEYASDPQISPDGSKIVYVRNFFDIMTDRQRSNLWIINFDGSDHRPLTSGKDSNFSPRWSPDGERLLYASTGEGPIQLFVRWMDTGQTWMLTNLTKSPGGLSWSPDGSMIAFSMFVSQPSKPYVSMPSKPDGAEWAKPPVFITKLQYRADGAGYLEDGFNHLFVLPAEGGTPRQVTSGDFNHGGTPAWSADGKSLIFSANRHDDGEYDPQNSEIYEVSLDDGSIIALTDRQGPDGNPVVSPDGRHIAYLGYDDRLQGYQLTNLYVMNRDGSGSKLITGGFDRNVQSPVWSGDGSGLYFQYVN